MLTKDQQKWVDHLSDVDTINILPFNTNVGKIFEEIKEQIKLILGKETEVVHRGASGLGISGQSEIDVYIPVRAEKIEPMASKMEVVFGKPKSIYPEERTKFIKFVEGTKLEIILVNKACKSWIDGEIFNTYLKKNISVLEEYRKLKEDGNGLSVREYYRRKIEFINDILSR